MRTRFAHLAFMVIAAIATMYAAAAFLFRFDADFTVAATIALLALGGVFAVDHLAHERERMAHGREAVWRRRILEQDEWELDEDDALREVD